MLRFITYLAPSIPRALFELIATHVGEELGTEVSLRCETRLSGPVPGDDPFSRGLADVGFMCSPPFLKLRELRELRPSPVELLAAAPLYSDPRCEGHPVYFSDLVVHRDSPVRSFSDLRNRSWAYNDPCALSGYYSMLRRLAEIGAGTDFFGHVRRSRSHLSSLRLVASGQVDAAAIDSNALAFWLGRVPGEGRAGAIPNDPVRIIESWGPCPIQPVVVRSGLEPEWTHGVLRALLTMAAGGARQEALARFGVERFVPVSEDLYERERSILTVGDAFPLAGASPRGSRRQPYAAENQTA